MDILGKVLKYMMKMKMIKNKKIDVFKFIPL